MLNYFLASIMLLIAPAPTQEPAELLPGIFVAPGFVEFTGEIAIDCHHPDTPDIFLEMLITAPDSREHESLIVTSIKPSALHAAMLAAGFTPGKPIRWASPSGEEKTIQATGDRLEVFYSIVDGSDAANVEEFMPIESLVVDIKTRDTLLESTDRPDLVFSGSSLTKLGYAADRAGTIMSLTPFGDEVISPTWTRSPQADIDEPEWIANNERMPPKGTPVRVRILAVQTENDVSEKTDPSESEN